MISYVVDTRPYVWENVLIAGNEFVLTDLVRNLIQLSFGAKNTTVRNMTIENNTITHSEYAVEENVENSSLNDFERDFAVLSQSDNEVRVSIRNNTITANHTVYTDSNFYVNLMVDGATVDYIGNNIDATGMARLKDTTGKYITVGIIVSEFVGVGGKLTMQDNDIRGIYRLGRCYFSTSTNTNVTLNAINNHFEGDNRIWCRNNDLKNMTAIICGNEFVSDTPLLLFQNFGTEGSFSVCDNVWTKSSLYSGDAKIFSADNTYTPTELQKIVVAGNQFLEFAESDVFFKYLPTARICITEKNIFKQ